MAPEGFIADSTTRAQSIEELKAVFSKRSQPELDDALDFLNSLGGDRGIGRVLNPIGLATIIILR